MNKPDTAQPSYCRTNITTTDGMMICVPMTTKAKGYPFEILIAGATPSVALADQVKNVDWRARGATPKGWVKAQELSDVRQMAATLIGV
jgi:mRNA interferase MazF